MEIKELTEALAQVEANLEIKNNLELKAQFDAFKLELGDLGVKEIEAKLAEITKNLENLDVKVQKGNEDKKGEKSLVQVIDEKKEELKSLSSKKGTEIEFQVKANTVRANVAGSTDALRLGEIGQIATAKRTMYDLFPKVPVGQNSNGVIRYTDWDPATTVRAAATVAEGATFAESTAKWQEYALNLNKIGDTIPVSEELLYDAPRFAAELGQFLSVNVEIVRNTQLLTGDGTGTNLTGLSTSATAYVPVAGGIKDASHADLIVKVSESITKTGGSKYAPNFILMNIGEINKIRLKKDANNNYVDLPFASDDKMAIAGMTVIEENSVPDNQMIIGDSRFAKIYEVEGYNISTGYINEQFTSDLLTLKAKTRLNLLIRNVDKGAFAKVTDISAALVTIAG